MGVFNTLRNKMGRFLVVIIGISIMAFVLADLKPSLFGVDEPVVGEIGGDEIQLSEFNEVYDEIERNYQMQTGRTPSEEEKSSLRMQAWNELVNRRVFYKEFEKLGLTISPAELRAMVQGDDTLFIDEQVKQIPIFQDSATQKFDVKNVRRYLSLAQQNPQYQAMWELFEESLMKQRLQKKYENLATFSTYITSAEAERGYRNETETVSADYIFIPYTSIPDSSIKITDEQLKKYLSEHKSQYEVEAQRSIEYVTFDILPSKEDSLVFYKELDDLKAALQNSNNDSSFVMINEAETSSEFAYKTVDRLPGFLQDQDKIELKKVYGPYLEGGKYQITKVIEQSEDTLYFVKARHILIKPANDKDEAKARAQKLLNQLIVGEIDFEEAAGQYSDDKSNSANGGNLGWFGKGKMVAPFQKASFEANKEGVIPRLVETQFGFHIIEVLKTKSNKKYKLASISRMIYPLDKTIDAAFNEASSFQSECDNTEAFRTKIEADSSLNLETAEKLKLNAQSISGLRNVREVIKWAFNEAEVGDVSPVFELREQNKFIVATLVEKVERDELLIENLRDQLKKEVLNELKAEKILKKIDTGKGSLEEIAKAYGDNISVKTADNIKMTSNTLGTAGLSPVAVGRAFALKEGEISKAFADERGVLVLKVTQRESAPEIADYSQYQNKLLSQIKGRIPYYTREAAKDLADIEDWLGKVY